MDEGCVNVLLTPMTAAINGFSRLPRLRNGSDNGACSASLKDLGASIKFYCVFQFVSYNECSSDD